MGVRGGRGVEKDRKVSFVGHPLVVERMQNPTPEEEVINVEIAKARSRIEDMRGQIVFGISHGLRTTGYERLMAVAIVDEVEGKLRLEKIKHDRNFERIKIQNNIGI
jgi:hypothetical protein